MKKKIVTLLLASAMSLSITACGGSGDSVQKDTETQTTAPAETDTEDEEELISGKVDLINIDNEEGTLSYTKHEVSTDYEGNPVIVVYFDYTNKKPETSYSQMTFYPQAFQNGVECDYGILMEENEGVNNSTKEITTGTTLNVAFVYELQDTENVVTMKVTDQSAENLFKDYYQDQDLALK